MAPIANRQAASRRDPETRIADSFPGARLLIVD
jgi:hypothetical protein